MSCFPISTIELAETQAGIKKEPTKEALNLNGGNDEARTRDLMRDSLNFTPFCDFY